MTCKTVRQQLDAYTLGELDLPVERALIAHLAICPLCEAAALASRRQTADISAALKTELMAPPDMLDRFQRRLSQTPAKPRPAYAKWATVLLSLTTIAYATVSLWPRSVPSGGSHGRPLSSLATAWLPEPNPSITPIHALLAIHRETGVAMVQPNVGAIGGRYLGASCAQMGRYDGMALRYRLGSGTVTFMQLPSAALSFEGAAGVCGRGHHYYLSSQGRTSVVAWRSGNTTCALVAPLEEERLLDLAIRIDP